MKFYVTKRQRRLAGIMAGVLAGTLLLSSPLPAAAAPRTAGGPALRFDEPVSRGTRLPNMAGGFGTTAEDDIWQQLTLPIGNGSIGANIYGEVSRERLTFNEKTLWNGGPSDLRPDYNGGNLERANDGTAMSDVFHQVQQYYLEGNDSAANSLAQQLVGAMDGYGAYQSWGDIYLDYGFEDDTCSGYARSLDLGTALSAVDFEKDGTAYHREYFVSYPDQVLAVKLTARGGDKMNLNITFPVDNAEGVSDRRLGKEVTARAEGGRLTVAGQMQDNQLQMNGQILVASAGTGTVAPGADGESLDVRGADQVILYVAADTDYKDEYPAYRTGDTAQSLDARVRGLADRAAEKGYDAVKADHEADYREIFDRVTLDLGQGGAVTDKTTDALLDAYRKGTAEETEKRILETLLFQYGRYLTIASSRDGDLPSNLQGLWQNRVGDANRVPWGSDYHMNVNLQMNYWPTYSTNMLECARPLVDYINGMKEPGRLTARTYFGVTDGGFTAHTQNTPFGWTCPGWAFSWGWSPAALPWILQNCYEYYEYSGDVDYLRENIYPLLKESALLYDQILIEKDGRLVSAPAYSPEHGPVTAGNTYEQSLIWQLYEDAIHSAEVLGVDADKAARWRETQSRLRPIEIGDSGQIKEWYTETALGSMGESGHRHMSHLLGLFPGDLISVDNAEYMDAAIVSLTERGYSSTGWGVGQRINAWARTGMGDSAYKSIASLLKGGIYPNLWDSHAPFQIDGNFGYTSGVAEMLLQSNMNYINILPALPSVWSEGRVSGLVARGNFVVDIDWTEGSPYRVGIASRNGGEAAVQSDNISMATVLDAQGRPVEYTVLAADRISFPTEKGQTYTIVNLPARGSAIAAPEQVKALRTSPDSVDVAWEAVEGENISYEVYRRIDGGDLVKMAEGIKELSWTDGGAAEFLGGFSYQVRACSGQDSDKVRGDLSEAAAVYEPVNLSGMIDDRDKHIVYSGSWGTYGEDGLYNRTSTFVENPVGNETAELTFIGTGFQIYATVNSDRGLADVYVDGAKHGQADSYAPAKANYTEIYSVDGLSQGVHTVLLQVANQKNPASSRTKFEFDAFAVVNPEAPSANIEVKSQNGMTTLARAGSSLQMTASVNGVPGDGAVVWSVEPAGLASIDTDGILTAGNISGVVEVKAVSAADANIAGTAQVTIEMPTVSTGDSVLDEGAITEFNVSGNDNNGGGTLNQDHLTWTGGGWGTWGGEDGHYNRDKVDGVGNGDSVEIRFTGARIEIYGALNSTFSRLGVTLDGVDQPDVDVDTQGDAKNVLLTAYGNLEDTDHTLKLTVKQKDGKTKVALDYFKVYSLITVPGEDRDKTGLQSVIENFAGKYEEEYTADSFAPFKTALERALNVMNTPGGAQADIDAASQALAQAGAALAALPGGAPAPVIPSDAQVTPRAVESATLMLTWTHVDKAVKYRISGEQAGGLTRTAALLGETDKPYYRVSGLNPATEYYFTVEAVNRAGKAAPIQRIAVTTTEEADLTAPDPVTGLARDPDTERLTWSASPSADVALYEIWINGKRAGTVPAEGELAFDLSPLPDGVVTVSVTAVDAELNRSVPAVLTFVKAPVTPELVSLRAIGDIQVFTGTAFEDLGLPVNILGEVDPGGEIRIPVTWSRGNYNSAAEGTYELSGELTLPQGIANPQALKPSVKIHVVSGTAAAGRLISVERQTLTVPFATGAEEAAAALPSAVNAAVSYDDGSTETIAVRVTWIPGPDYSGTRSGVYEFTGRIAADAGYTNPSQMQAFASVTVAEPADVGGGGDNGDGGSNGNNGGGPDGGSNGNSGGGGPDGGQGNSDTKLPSPQMNAPFGRKSPATYDGSLFVPELSQAGRADRAAGVGQGNAVAAGTGAAVSGAMPAAAGLLTAGICAALAVILAVYRRRRPGK